LSTNSAVFVPVTRSRSDCFVDQPRQSHAALDRLVVNEMQLGNAAQLNALAKLVPQEAGGVVQAGARRLDLVTGAERRKKTLACA